MNPKAPQKLLVITQVVDDLDDNLGFFVSWLRALASEGIELTVVCWRHRVGTPLPPNTRVIELPPGKFARTIRLMSLSWSLRNSVHHVFVHMLPPVIVALGWYWKLLGWRVILWYTHGTITPSLRMAEFFFDALVTASAESCRLTTSKKIITGHGIDLDQLRAINVPREPLLLMVGRITARKDQFALIAMVQALRKLDPKLLFHVSIVGAPRTAADERYQQALQVEIQRHNLQDDIQLLGPKTGADLVAIYSRAAMLVSASQTGSLDKVVLEALACETPVIAIGQVYAAIPGVLVAPSLVDALALSRLSAALHQPQAYPTGRETVRQIADLHQLARRLREAVFIPQTKPNG